ncbi:MAG TPA: Rieske 2Fe-2S domain-containing protein [Candidatus Binataceae bacterium]|nr:Rieske 2Fe-2S domain-containing protein [Candidatus Binataceae bacterium]
MLSPQDNELLCRVQGDAPMGQIMRRQWLPAALSEELAESDGTPRRVRLLGEDLVLFRDSLGRLGALDEHCPHRRASLVYGRNEDCGLRCLFHGWKFDVEGNVVDMASEPTGSSLREKVKHKSYPTHEAAGFVWIYMGPPNQQPRFQAPPWAPTAQTRVSIVKMHIRCNWAQVLEGAIDSSHSSSLHSTDIAPAQVAGAQANDKQWLRPSTDKAPRMRAQVHKWGFRYAAIRTPIFNPETHDYVRITVYIAPFTVLIPPNNMYKLSQAIIPIDDHNTMFHFIAWHETAGIDQEAWRRYCVARPGIDLDANWLPIRSHDNHYLQDRRAMKEGSFTGMDGIPTQDMAMWESMGAIADRSQERLGISDLAVAQFRKQMVAAAKAVRAGQPAIGTAGLELGQARVSSFEGIVPKTTDWRTLGYEPAPGEDAADHARSPDAQP